MLIDLHERDWALTVQSAQHRNRDSVVAADDDRKRTCGRNLANRRFGAAVMRLEVGWVGAYVAAIYRTNRLAVIEWAAEVEVVALERTHDPIARLPHRLRHVGLVIDDLLESVGIPERNA